MPKTRAQKEAVLADFQKKLESMKSMVIATYRNVTFNDEYVLRNKLRADSSTFVVVKKTLLKKALEGMAGEGLSIDSGKGTFGVAFSDTDEVAPARQTYAFIKDHENFSILGGLMVREGKKEVLRAADVKVLATLPSREELIAKAVGSIRAPLAGLVGVLSGTTRNFVYALRAISEKKTT